MTRLGPEDFSGGADRLIDEAEDQYNTPGADPRDPVSGIKFSGADLQEALRRYALENPSRFQRLRRRIVRFIRGGGD